MTERSDENADPATSPGALTERRSRRPRQRKRAERGLPLPAALRELARTYYDTQSKLWPELVGTEILPIPTESVLAMAAESFRTDFLGGEPVAPTLPPGLRMAAAYVRYSSDNSNPRSLDQQLRLQLERARADGRFIPWACVFADAGVSGTTAKRRGYQMARKALKFARLEALYIDELSRANRNMLEALELGQLVEHHRKFLFGVSDGFDSSSPNWKMQLTIISMMHEMFVTQLRAKVYRGMSDAFARGLNIHPLPLGYALEPARDAQGRPILGKDNAALNKPVINKEEADQVRLAFRLFLEERWSPERIARRFNELEVGAQVTWDRTRMLQLLRRHTYVGIEVYGKSRQVRDPETKAIKVIQTPRKEWRIRRSRELQVISWSIWKATQHRLEACRGAYRKDRPPAAATRTELYPKVLVRPVCGTCLTEMAFGRSGNHPSFTCLNGLLGKHGCTHRGYKSAKIIIDAVLMAVRSRIFNDSFLERLVGEANAFLAQEARRPREDTRAIEARIREVDAKRQRLIKLLDGKDATDLEPVVAKIGEQGRELKALREQLAELRARNAGPPKPLTRQDVETLLSDLRTILEGDIAAAAPILRQLTGPVVVSVEPASEGRKSAWTAKFTVDAVPVLARLASGKDHPTTMTWEYLNRGRWTLPDDGPISVPLEALPKYARLAPLVAELSGRGTSIETIARSLNVAHETIASALRYAQSGERPSIPSPKRFRPRPRKPAGGPPLCVTRAAEVARLRDVERYSFDAIAELLGISVSTATRAYDRAHRDNLTSAAEAGHTPFRGPRGRRLKRRSKAE